MDNVIQYIFSEEGPIKDLKPDYIPRPSQIDASVQLYDRLKSNNHFILEGPCGFGKTFAYLIPIYQELMETGFTKTAVIVTNGISLQEQLFYKDTPLISKIMKLNNPEVDFKIAILKGKQNFVCVNKMADIIADGFAGAAKISNLEEFEKVRNWYYETKNGDFSELDFVPTFETAQDTSCVSEGECLGKGCPKYNECFYYKHKFKVNSADIIITNYHMLFSDLKTGGKILPKYDMLVFDEAHEAPSIYREYRAIKATKNTMRKIRNDFSEIFNKDQGFKIAYQDAFDAARFIGLCDVFFDGVDKELFTFKWDTIKVFEEGWVLPGAKDFLSELNRVADMVYDINEQTTQQLLVMRESGVEEDDEDYINKQRVFLKSSSLVDKLSEIVHIVANYASIAVNENDIFYVEKEKDIVSINHKPLMVGESLYNNFLCNESLSCIMTSATLSVNENFEYIKEQTGFSLVPQERLGEFIGISPFDLTKQQLWYLPEPSIDGNASNFDEMLPRNVEKVIKACGGGVLCLFTSIKNMRNTYDNLKWDLNGYTLLKQGDKPRTQLIEQFKDDKDSVLFATKSFFTGIDVPGDALRCVVIDKFPFPTPNDPVQQKLRSRPNAFYKYSVPEMVITLKQAVGRGVRSIADKCVIAILDGRMATAKYKGRINNSFNYQKTGTRSVEEIMKFCGNESMENKAPNPYFKDDVSIDYYDDVPF